MSGNQYTSPAQGNTHEVLDPASPIDALVIRFQQQVIDDTFPSPAEQRKLIFSVQREDPGAARELRAINASLIGTVAHRFKGLGVEDNALLNASAEALTYLAQIYSMDEHGSFVDQAIVEMETELAMLTKRSLPSLPGSPEDGPWERLVHYATAIPVPAKPAPKRRRSAAVREPKIAELPPLSKEQLAINQEILELFTPVQQSVVLLLILPVQEVSEQTDLTVDQVTNAMKNARAQLEPKPPTKTAFVAELYRRGFRYQHRVLMEPLVEVLPNEEIEIGHMLEQTNEATAKARNKSVSAIDEAVSRLKRRIGARSRPESFLMIQLADTGERRAKDDLPPSKTLPDRLGLLSLEGYDLDGMLSELKPTQQEAIVARHLAANGLTPWDEVGEQLGVSGAAAAKLVQRGIQNLRKSLDSDTSRVEPSGPSEE